MKRLFIISVLLFSYNYSFGQIFTGTSLDKNENYNLSLKINKDSTVLFIYSQSNVLYGEHFGNIHKINDSTYHISATMTFGKFDVMHLNMFDPITGITNDTNYFSIDTPYVNQNDTVIIKYTNGQSQLFFPYNIQGKKEYFKLDKKQYNQKVGSNYYTIGIRRKNPITEEPLTFSVLYGSGADFYSGEVLEFDIIIQGNKLWSIGMPIMQTGHFKLQKTN